MSADIVGDLRRAEAALSRVRALADVEDKRVAVVNARLARQALEDADMRPAKGGPHYVIVGMLTTAEIREALEDRP